MSQNRLVSLVPDYLRNKAMISTINVSSNSNSVNVHRSSTPLWGGKPPAVSGYSLYFLLSHIRSKKSLVLRLPAQILC